MKRGPPPLSRRLLLSAVATVVLLCAVELGFRAAGYGRLVVVARDPDLGWRNVPSQDRRTERGDFEVHINAHGFRDDEFPREKPEGEFRVLVLGDSLTYGLDADQERIWPRVLHRVLAARAPRIRVLNAAVQGYDARQERNLLLRDGFDFGP